MINKHLKELIKIVDDGYNESIFVSWEKVVKLVEEIKNENKNE